MSQKQGTIVKISDGVAFVGLPDETFFAVSINELDFSPTIGDVVNVYSDGSTKIITKTGIQNNRVEAENAESSTANSNFSGNYESQKTCPKCGETCSEDSELCPSCGYAFFTGKKILLGVCISIPILAIMFLIKQCTTPSKVDMNLSVATFVDETVQDNKVFAEKKYSGKRVGITGCFTKAENTNSDLYVYIEDCNAWLFASTVSGSMKKSQRDKIARLTKGQNIRLECDVKKTATFLGSINLRLKNCTIPDSY